MRHLPGALVEYSLIVPPLVLAFEINPRTISRTRTVTLHSEAPPGSRGTAFTSPADVPLVAQGASVQAESFTVVVLLDATERMNGGDTLAGTLGVEPELDTLRSMLEPKTQGPAGVQVLASLGVGGQRAFQRAKASSVQLFVWGTHVLPVFLTSVRVEELAHLPSLHPYRAEATLTMQVIEGANPFYLAEQLRQTAGAALNLGATVSSAIGGLS